MNSRYSKLAHVIAGTLASTALLCTTALSAPITFTWPAAPDITVQSYVVQLSTEKKWVDLLTTSSTNVLVNVPNDNKMYCYRVLPVLPNAKRGIHNRVVCVRESLPTTGPLHTKD